MINANFTFHWKKLQYSFLQKQRITMSSGPYFSSHKNSVRRLIIMRLLWSRTQIVNTNF